MKAAVMEGLHQPLVVRDVPVPPIGPRDVLVRVKGAGVCHSDVHHVDGSAGDITISKFPHILGHEVTGQVDKMGSDVTHLQVGDRVGVSHMFACGRCPNCLSGEEEVCDTLFSDDAYIGGVTADGGYAEYMRVPADFALPLPEELDYVEAAPLFCAGLSVYAALKCAHIKPGQRAAILGVGGLGHMAIPIARAMGAEVIAITSSDWKLALSKELGAAQVISGKRRHRAEAPRRRGRRCGGVHHDRHEGHCERDGRAVSQRCPGPHRPNPGASADRAGAAHLRPAAYSGQPRRVAPWTCTS